MSWAAVIAAGVSLVGGYVSSQGAKKAAGTAAAGTDAAIAEQQREYNQARADNADYRAIGNQAINALGSIYGYAPAAKPLSFDDWSKQHPEASVLPPTKKPGFLQQQVTRMTDPTAAFRDVGLIKGSSADPNAGYNQAQSRYQDYLAGFDYSPVAGSAPKTPPGNALAPATGISSSMTGSNPSGYILTGDGGIKQGIPGGSGPVTIDNTTGQVVNDTAAGSPMPAGPDYSNFFASPDYQFRRQQGTQGIERTAAARGLLKSGNALQALTEYNSNLAAGEFGNYFNRQASLAGIGQTAVNTTTQAGMNAANNTSNALVAGANARASGIADSANAWGNALGTVAGVVYDKWGRPVRTGYGGYSGAPRSVDSTIPGG